MLVDSPYTKLLQSKDQLLYTGYDYRGQIFRRTMSKQMYAVNSKVVGFLDKIEAVFYEMLENVKLIKTFANPAMDKNERRII